MYSLIECVTQLHKFYEKYKHYFFRRLLLNALRVN